jgi:hypothetical protein
MTKKQVLKDIDLLVNSEPAFWFPPSNLSDEGGESRLIGVGLDLAATFLTGEKDQKYYTNIEPLRLIPYYWHATKPLGSQKDILRYQQAIGRLSLDIQGLFTDGSPDSIASQIEASLMRIVADDNLDILADWFRSACKVLDLLFDSDADFYALLEPLREESPVYWEFLGIQALTSIFDYEGKRKSGDFVPLSKPTESEQTAIEVSGLKL